MRGIAATLAVFVSMSFCPATHAQGNISANQENRLAAHHGGGDRNPEMETNVQALASWQDAKFGLSVHWDPSALRGVEISWTRGGAGAGWVQGALSAKEYDALYKEFNPALFNAKEWVQLWKDTGVRYVTPGEQAPRRLCDVGYEADGL